jgi:hypothetical protein
MYLRRAHQLIALGLLLCWLPLSTFAQVCATHSVAVNVGGLQHPAMPQTSAEFHAAALDETLSFEQMAANVVVIDAETFWKTVDEYDDACDATAMCALAAAAALLHDEHRLVLPQSGGRVAHFEQFPNSYINAPDAPPPRSIS